MTVLVHFDKVCSAIAYFIALGLFIPAHPDFEAIQQFEWERAPDIENLNINRSNVVLRPIDHISSASRQAERRNNQQQYQNHN
jgi:hypothetical protein